MVLVATRRHAGKAKGPGLTNPRSFLTRILVYLSAASPELLRGVDAGYKHRVGVRR
jgi:hypothetical protein